MDAASVNFLVGGKQVTISGEPQDFVESIGATDWNDHKLVKLAKGLPKNAVCLDIGANIGSTAIAMAAACPGHRIHAFEPLKANIHYLRKNIEMSGVGNCSIIESAVGETVGEISMGGHGPYAFISDRQGDIAVVTIDHYCANNLAGTRIDLIKIDVEGYEPNVLAGAMHTIETWRPVIYMEFNSWSLLVQSINPIRFSEVLMERFDVESPEGMTWETPAELALHNLKNGCVTDVILRYKGPGNRVQPRSMGFGEKMLALFRSLKS